MKRSLLLALMLFGMLSTAFAQSTVSGTVKDDSGEPLPGATVTIKGTTSGAVADIDGKYTIKVPNAADAVLVFSFVGFTSLEVKVGNQSVIDVALKTDNVLEEVVVTGYGTTSKSDIGGSIAKVKAEDIANVPSASFQSALQGKMAGVQVQAASGAPGAQVRITIRGQGSLSSNSPLYVVDGVQMNSGTTTTQGSSNALAGLNSNDIESIEVLKDAAAAAIYGAQAANGVVLITTKRGKSGKSNITFTMQQGFTQPLELYDVMNATEFATIKEEAYINAGLDPLDAHALYGNPNDASTITNYDWVDAIFREKAKLSTYDLSISGGDEKTTFYLSAAFHTQEGQVIQSDWKRGTLRFNLGHKVNKKLRVDTQLSFSATDQFGSISDGNFVNGPFQSAFVSQPNSPAFDDTGNYNAYPLNGSGHNFSYNIIQGVNEERRTGTTVQSIASLKLTYNILPDLAITTFGGVDYASIRDINNRPSTIPAFASYGGSAFEGQRTVVNFNTNATLNYSKTIGEDHNFSALLGFEYKQETEDRITATGRGFANPKLTTLNSAATPFAVGGFNTGYKRAGVFGRANYDYKGKYFLNATLRRDGNSRFGANNQFGTFYAIGATWRLSDESFMDNISVVEEMKVRVSYGKLGNADGIGNFSSRALYGGAGQYLGFAGQAPSLLANDILSWEEQIQTNIGIDYGLFKNRVFGSIDFWRSNTAEQLLAVPLPTDSGFGSITGNAGNVKNEGIDVELSTVNIDKGGFKWNTTLTFTVQRNEVTELANGEDRVGTTYFVGQPVANYFLVPYAGVNPANGRAMYYDINEQLTYSPTDADQRVMGSPLPNYLGGFTNTVSYKGLTLDVFFQYEAGHEAFLGDLFNLAASGASTDNQLRSQLNRWQQPGDITSVPIAYEGGIVNGVSQQSPNGLGTSRYMMDASYIRLKRVQLSYELPKDLLSKIGVNRANVFVQALNLATITKFDGIDPEVVSSQGAAGGSTYGNFPNGKQFTMGLTVGF